MGLFEKKVKIYEKKGSREEWKMLKKHLKENGISGVSGFIWQDELPVCGCGAAMDVRDFGAGKRIDRDVYAIRVAVKDEKRAISLLMEQLPDYVPYTACQNK